MKWLNEKRLFQIHGWLGLHLGLLLFIVCFSGTWAVFSHDLDWLVDPALRVTPPANGAGETLGLGTLHRRVAEAYPQATIRYLNASPHPRTAAHAVITYGPSNYRWVLIDPYTGEVRGQSSTLNLASFFRIFHKQFHILSSDYWPHGRVFVCSLSIVLLFSAVTGLLFYKKWWRSLVRLRFGHSRRVFWSDLHRMVGVWSLLFALLFGVTGVWYLTAQFLGDLGMAYQPEPPRIDEGALAERGAVLEPLPLDRCIAIAQAAYPELEVDGVFPVTRMGDPVMVQGQAEAALVDSGANRVYVDPYSGEVMRVQRGAGLTAFQRWVHTADPLHFGQFGGMVTKVIWFVAGLAISVGILGGTLIWWLRVKRRSGAFFKKNRGWTAFFLVLNLAVLVLAISSAISFTTNQLEQSSNTLAGVRIGPVRVGPWRASLFRHGVVSEEGVRVSVRFEGGAHPNFRRAWVWVGEGSGQPPSMEPLRGSVGQLWGSVRPGGSGGADGEPGCLSIAIEGWDGERHTASVEWSEVVRAGTVVDLPPAPELPTGVLVVIVLFCVMTATPVLLWLVYVR